MKHTVKLIKTQRGKDSSKNRHFTAEIDGILIKGHFKLVNQYKPEVNYRFCFPDNSLIMKHEDWKEIRKQLLLMFNSKYESELDTTAVRRGDHAIR